MQDFLLVYSTKDWRLMQNDIGLMFFEATDVLHNMLLHKGKVRIH